MNGSFRQYIAKEEKTMSDEPAPAAAMAYFAAVSGVVPKPIEVY
jgi:hypothetical protein